MRCISAAFLLVVLLPRAGADEHLERVTLTGESANAGRQLQAARKLAQDKAWPDALVQYQQLIENSGDDLVPLDGLHAVALRWLCHTDIVHWPAEALKLYRQRVDAPANRWLEVGIRDRNERLLARVVDEAFASTAAARALESLGDLAFERGQLPEARRWYRLLAGPLPPRQVDDSPSHLAYPAADVGDLALVRAKQVLVLLFLDDRKEFTRELEAFAALHPDAAGDLAGRKGKYVDTLKALAAPGQRLGLAHPADAWPTFGGDPSRSRSIPGNIDRLGRMCAGRPLWRFDLQKYKPLDRGELRQSGSSNQRAALTLEPIIVGDHVLVADARRITAYGITTGEVATWYDLEKDPLLRASLLDKLPARPFLRHTLTSAEGHIVARLGSDAIGDDSLGRGGTFLVCLRDKPNRKGERLCWTATAANQAGKDNREYFEGAPVIRDGRVYVASTSISGLQKTTHIQCFALDVDSDSPGPARRLWKQEVCSVKEDRAEPRYRHHLVTLAGRNVVYATHNGAIVAVDAVSGRRVWARRYRSRGPDLAADRPSPRDLAPCVYAEGRLYFAPQDDNRILCLDPDTGELIWERDGIEVVDLLGVARGKLIFTFMVVGASSAELPAVLCPMGIRAIDACSGANTGGWLQPGYESKLGLFGRGLFFGTAILCPIGNHVAVLDQEDGQPFYVPTLDAVPPGNLAYADGCLAVADVHELRLYVSAARQSGEREAQAGARPASPAAQLRMAESYLDEGSFVSARARCRRARELAENLPASRRRDLPRRTQALQHEALLQQADHAAQLGDGAVAATCLTEAAKGEFTNAQRVQALVRTAQLQPDQAVRCWQAILANPTLRTVPVADSVGLTRLARTEAQRHIDEVFDAQGAEALRILDAQAASFLKENATSDRIDLLQRLTTEFPCTSAALKSLTELAQLYERNARWGAAARAYRLLLRWSHEPDARDQVLGRLARCYEHQLKPPQYAPSAVSESPSLWRERWHVELAPGERIVNSEASDHHLPAEWFTAGGGQMRCRESGNAAIRWAVSMSATADWCGRWLDLVILGGPDEVSCRSIADGELLWRIGRADERGTFAEFRLTASRPGERGEGGRLYFLHARNRLAAVDPVTGAPLWSAWTPAGLGRPSFDSGFLPSYLALPNHVIAPTDSGVVLVLDARTGVEQHRLVPDGAIGMQGSCSPPLLLRDSTVCLALDQDHVIAYDCARGKEAWRYRLPFAANRTGHWPQVLGTGSALLVVFSLNFGWFAQALDPANGKPLWESPQQLGGVEAPEGLSISDITLQYFREHTLTARNSKDGHLLWQSAALPGRNRTLYQVPSVLMFPEVEESTRIGLRWLFWTVEWQSSSVARRGDFPVSCHDAVSGRLLQSLNFRPADARRILTWSRRTELGWQPGVSVDTLPNRCAPIIQPFAGAMLVQVGREAWALNLAERKE